MALKTFTTADGSANQALVTNGSGVLSFAAVGASAGQVIQVLGATDSTERTTTSTSFVTASNTLSVTITPSSASNKIFIIVSTGIETPGDSYACYFTIYRGATNLGDATYGFARVNEAQFSMNLGLAMSYLDSPNTTSAITYQLYFYAQSGAPGSAKINKNGAVGSITCFEIKG